MTEVLFKGNDHLLEVSDLKNGSTGEFVNDATIVVTLVDADSVEVVGQDWPTQMAYVAGSDGKYRCILDDSLELVHGGFYTAIITADAGSDLKAYWELRCQADTRRST